MITTRQEASWAVLGTIFLVPSTLERLVSDHGLRLEHFYGPADKALFEAMSLLTETGEPIDKLTLASKLAELPTSRDRPWPLDEQQITASVRRVAEGDVPLIGNVAAYVKILQQEHEWEQRGHALTSAGEALHARSLDSFHAAISELDQVGARHTGDIVTAEQLGSEFIDWYTAENTGAIPTPFPQLNDMLAGGWLPGATTVVAAWSSMGKSILVDQCATHVTSLDVGKRACVYTNEMVRETRTARTISRMTGVPFRRIMRKELQGDEYDKVAKAAGRLPFPIKECAGWSADEIASHIRRHKWDVWVVDLVTRIPARDTADWDHISGALTNVALQTGTHGILVCQLNQERNKTLIKPPPVQRDLRNTGSWYNDATNVVFLHRDQEEMTKTDGEPMGIAKVLSDGTVRVEKSRNDEPGVMPVTFDPKRMQFEPLSHYSLSAVA